MFRAKLNSVGQIIVERVGANYLPSAAEVVFDVPPSPEEALRAFPATTPMSDATFNSIIQIEIDMLEAQSLRALRELAIQTRVRDAVEHLTAIEEAIAGLRSMRKPLRP